MKKNKNHGYLIGLIILSLFFLLITLFPKTFNANEKYTEFLKTMEDGKVSTAYYNSELSTFKYQIKGSNKYYVTENPQTDTFKETMLKNGIRVIDARDNSKMISKFFTYLLVFVEIGFVLFLIIIVKSNFKLKKDQDSGMAERPKTRFSDVAGLDEIKEELSTIVDMVKAPDKFSGLGAHLSHGILLEGSPGNGKTLLARALAGEMGMNFYACNASQFIELFVGLGASRIRKLFKDAREHSPAIIFIDELDAIGGARHGGEGGGEKEYTQCLNAILSEMDGFKQDHKILVLAATNRACDLDPALVRAGRFDKKFSINNPDYKTRLEILSLYSKNKKFADNVLFEKIAKETSGFSSSAIESLLNEAAMLAANAGKSEISCSEIEQCIIQIVANGKIKKNSDVSEENFKKICIHEAGHAVATHLLTDDIISRVSVLATTSGAGGFTMSYPKNEVLNSVNYYKKQVQILYAGRAAEFCYLCNRVPAGDVSFDDVSVGAVSDINKATGLIKTICSMTTLNNGALLDYSQFGFSGEKSMIEMSQNLSKELWDKTVKMIKLNFDSVLSFSDLLSDKKYLSESEINKFFG